MLVPRNTRLILTLAALPFLAGSSCAVFWSSGSGSSHDRDREEEGERLVIVAGGQLGDPTVEGLDYVSGSVSGTTGAKGEFEYEPGESVQFSVGDIRLGPPVSAKPEMSVQDLVQQDNEASTAAVNLRRFLRSLDVDPGDAAVTIPAQVRSAAVMSNGAVAASIGFLDFGDDDSFSSTASQLVAVLTNDYPFTAMLVDADAVAQSPTRSVAPR